MELLRLKDRAIELERNVSGLPRHGRPETIPLIVSLTACHYHKGHKMPASVQM